MSLQDTDIIPRAEKFARGIFVLVPLAAGQVLPNGIDRGGIIKIDNFDWADADVSSHLFF
jgi:hypothetical protein